MGARARARAPLRGAPATLERVARHPSEGRRAAPASPRTGSPRGNQTGRGARLEAAHPRATASSTCQTAAACRPRLRRRCGERRRRDVLAAPPGRGWRLRRRGQRNRLVQGGERRRVPTIGGFVDGFILPLLVPLRADALRLAAAQHYAVQHASERAGQHNGSSWPPSRGAANARRGASTQCQRWGQRNDDSEQWRSATRDAPPARPA